MNKNDWHNVLRVQRIKTTRWNNNLIKIELKTSISGVMISIKNVNTTFKAMTLF